METGTGLLWSPRGITTFGGARKKEKEEGFSGGRICTVIQSQWIESFEAEIVLKNWGKGAARHLYCCGAPVIGSQEGSVCNLKQGDSPVPKRTDN